MTTHPATSDGFVLSGRPESLGSLLRRTWQARGLIQILARKDFYVRYRRATFGLLWAAALPLLQAVVLSFVVSKFATFETSDDYVVFVLAGTVGWATFSTTLSPGSTAIVDGAGLSTKIYFPRLVLPLAVVVTGAYGLIISTFVLLVASIATGVGLGAHTLLIIPAAVLTLAVCAAFTVVLSALHVYFRDVRYLVQAALLIWIYLTPVMYPLSAIGGARRFVVANPLTGVVELYRAATVGAAPGLGGTILWALAWCGALAVLGLVLHRRFDRVFVDLL